MLGPWLSLKRRMPCSIKLAIADGARKDDDCVATDGRKMLEKGCRVDDHHCGRYLYVWRTLDHLWPAMVEESVGRRRGYPSLTILGPRPYWPMISSRADLGRHR
jgi:hypothetical protein